ncbi:MAG: DUF2283 domain-containing protein [Chloroflexi bacterium]|nr:DUF2283 domain-containing protein [Chloroflexota bacterium]
MRIKYSPDVDALLVELSPAHIDHAEEAGQFILHFSKAGELVLVEILDARDFVLDSLTSLIKGEEVKSS